MELLDGPELGSIIEGGVPVIVDELPDVVVEKIQQRRVGVDCLNCASNDIGDSTDAVLSQCQRVAINSFILREVNGLWHCL